MKKLLVILSISMISACSSSSRISDNDQNNGAASIISNKALESFKTKYKKSANNKAFAQSVSGAWNWSSDRTSIEHAETTALIACQRNNVKSEDLYPCKIINVNGKWKN